MGIQQEKELRLLGAAQVFAGVAIFAMATLPAMAQAGPPVTTGRPTDWTHHRLIFSDPGTLADADKKGSTAHVQAVLQDTRFQLQQLRRNPLLRPDSLPGAGPRKDPKPNKVAIHEDWNVTLSPTGGAGLVNPNAFPAKYSFGTTVYSCIRDYVVYPTGNAGNATTTGTIVAYNNLYVGAGGCAASAPTLLWDYNTAFTYVATGTGTADGSVVKTSPILSLDGTQVAFVQVNSAGTASLVLLKPGTSSTVVEMNTPTLNVANSAYRACVAPCMTRITFSGTGTVGDTWSAPFYDYTNDVIYVGDNVGKLHQFTDIFDNGTGPIETSTGFPTTLGATILASPVYDATSGLVFVGSEAGILYSVTASTGVLSATSGTLAANTAAGIFDAPLVDSTAGKVYVFVAYATNTGTGCTNKDNCVFQFATNFASGTFGTHETLGVGNTATGEQYLFSGDFDNIYYSSASGTAGNLYVVGITDPGFSGAAGSLFRIPISGTGTMGTPVATVLAPTFTTEPYPSPVTEFCNNGVNPCGVSGGQTTSGTDYIFFSLDRSNVTGCTSTSNVDGCLLAYNVSTGTPVLSSVQPETYSGTFNCFVTGGIVVDNAIPAGTEIGASEIYYMALNGTSTNLCGNAGGGNLLGVQSAQ